MTEINSYRDGHLKTIIEKFEGCNNENPHFVCSWDVLNLSVLFIYYTLAHSIYKAAFESLI